MRWLQAPGRTELVGVLYNIGKEIWVGGSDPKEQLSGMHRCLGSCVGVEMQDSVRLGIMKRI